MGLSEEPKAISDSQHCSIQSGFLPLTLLVPGTRHCGLVQAPQPACWRFRTESRRTIALSYVCVPVFCKDTKVGNGSICLPASTDCGMLCFLHFRRAICDGGLVSGDVMLLPLACGGGVPSSVGWFDRDREDIFRG